MSLNPSSAMSRYSLGFENAGVDLKLSPSYYFGSAWSQVVKIAQDAGITYCIERGKLVVTKPGTARQGGPVLISPETGMIAYPRFNQQYIIVNALFNPAVQYQGPVEIQSSLPAACGKFTVNKLQYELESLVPGGKWFMELECYSIKETTP